MACFVPLHVPESGQYSTNTEASAALHLQVSMKDLYTRDTDSDNVLALLRAKGLTDNSDKSRPHTAAMDKFQLRCSGNIIRRTEIQKLLIQL